MDFCYRVLDRIRNMDRKINIKQLLIAILQFLSFAVLYIISMTVLKEIYLFEWTARHLYIFLWVFVLILTFNRKYLISIAIAIGNIVGIIAGQFLGDYIRDERIRSISNNMTNEEIYKLQHHPGVEIWVATIFIFVILATLFKFLYKRFGR